MGKLDLDDLFQRVAEAAFQMELHDADRQGRAYLKAKKEHDLNLGRLKENATIRGTRNAKQLIDDTMERRIAFLRKEHAKEQAPALDVDANGYRRDTFQAAIDAAEKLRHPWNRNPVATWDELSNLAKAIEVHGQQEAIHTTSDGKIYDGINRRAALNILAANSKKPKSVKKDVQPFPDGDARILLLINTTSRHYRNLAQPQLYCIAAEQYEANNKTMTQENICASLGIPANKRRGVVLAQEVMREWAKKGLDADKSPFEAQKRGLIPALLANKVVKLDKGKAKAAMESFFATVATNPQKARNELRAAVTTRRKPNVVDEAEAALKKAMSAKLKPAQRSHLTNTLQRFLARLRAAATA
jgi:hypothetical protein